jgi:pSer/pThr/pTyr-binding forkhead associated (FHA) protein
VAFVVVEEKGQQVLRQELKGPIMSIGRDEANDLRLENRALSRRHAQLEVRGAGIWIRDLGSQNGTFINGERLEGARPIQGGDVISLGGKFQVRLEGTETTTSHSDPSGSAVAPVRAIVLQLSSRALSAARRTFFDLPLVLIAINTSPACASPAT